METICMTCQILFSGKNRENISKCCLLKILPRVLSVKVIAKTGNLSLGKRRYRKVRWTESEGCGSSLWQSISFCSIILPSSKFKRVSKLQPGQKIIEGEINEKDMQQHNSWIWQSVSHNPIKYDQTHPKGLSSYSPDKTKKCPHLPANLIFSDWVKKEAEMSL